MALLLRQSTSVVVPFGPAVLPADGLTLVTGLSSALQNATTGIMLSKNGGSYAVFHSVTATYAAYGDYKVTLDTTDTNTLGSLRVSFAGNAGALPIRQDYQVVPANVHDSLVGVTASTYLKTDVEAVLTVAANATLLGAHLNSGVIGTCDTATTGSTPTSFACSDIVTATANFYNGKQVWVTSGTLAGQCLGVVIGYVLTSGEGVFTVSPGSPSSGSLSTGDKVIII